MKIKKNLVVFSLLGLVFGFFVLGVSLLRLSRNKDLRVVAKENKQVVVKQEEQVTYPLPYPGILPDSPVYWLKMVRDRMLLILARTPEEKARKMLHYGNKRLAAAEKLLAKGKVKLGITTASKAEKYLEKAIWKWKEFESKQMKSELQKALKKHHQVIKSFEDKFSNEEIKGMLDRIQRGKEDLKAS